MAQRQLTIFESGGYSLKSFRPGAGWETECAVFHEVPAHQMNKTIAWAKAQGIAIEDNRASSRLNAAGPELLEALRECLREHGGFTIKGECERRALAAIAKATE